MAAPGLFGPGSTTWLVNREGVLLVGAGRALILQVAHPLVAAAVAEHSTYRQDPWGRLLRTIELTTRIVFGDADSSAAAAERLRRTHERVRGRTTERGGRFPAGTPYHAGDPDLLMWVHATLVDTSLLVYERYVAPLMIAQRVRYYEEQKRLAEVLGVPPAWLPATYTEFNEYVDSMLVGDELGVTKALEDVVDAVLRPPLPLFVRPLVEALNLATVGMLPHRLREELGLPWGPGRERLLSSSQGLMRTLLPLLPSVTRTFPGARSAERRCAGST